PFDNNFPLAIARTATASDEKTIEPIAKHAASSNSCQTKYNKTPIPKTVENTSTIAIDITGFKNLAKCTRDTDIPSKINKGAIIPIINTSDSKSNATGIGDKNITKPITI